MIYLIITFCILALALAVTLGALIWLFFNRKSHAKLLAQRYGALKVEVIRKIEDRFGSSRVQNTKSSKWYHVLYEVSHEGFNEHSGIFFHTELIFVDEKSQYWHLLALSAPTQTDNTFALTNLDELRARRALFNKPKEYLAAFGESPDRKQLVRLMGGVDDDKLSI